MEEKRKLRKVKNLNKIKGKVKDDGRGNAETKKFKTANKTLKNLFKKS